MNSSGLIRWLLAVVAMAAVAACSREPSIGPPDQVYTVRGVITGLPTPGKPMSELTIHHEPVPSFVDREGKTVGMASMEMPFTPARGVSLSRLTVGQKVEFTFEVRWKHSPFSRLTRIGVLPANTVLDLGGNKPQEQVR